MCMKTFLQFNQRVQYAMLIAGSVNLVMVYSRNSLERIMEHRVFTW